MAAMKAPAKKKPGRPPTGQTPAKERLARSKAALLAAGGTRKTINFTPEGAQDLADVMLTHAVDATVAVHMALHEQAKRDRRKK